ncbi:hypothetical protein Agub_g12966 [Astrephomene gubernaculifera]|uniref:Uncharacterized protein n=1 Tax=Astrephomene gubernaculifera TaxID=47775 RepID=A0AAD3E132_9CHLO|nr:hypothetical protein Agub_g12966 [Astrephomene gubernaculifera]
MSRVVNQPRGPGGPVRKHPEPSKHAEESEDDEYSDDGGRSADEIGKTFTYRSTLTPSEAAALESFKRRDRDDSEEELYPLPPRQRNVTYVDLRRPLRSRSLGSDWEALCMALSHSGNTLAIGGRQGVVQLLNPATLEPMDTLVMSQLLSSSSSSSSFTSSAAASTSSNAAGSSFGPNAAGSRAGAAGTATATTTARTATAGSTGAAAVGAAAGDPGQGDPSGGGGLPGGSSRGSSSADGGSAGVITSVCFRPDLPSSRMENVLLVAQGDSISHLHVGTRRLLHRCREAGNKVNTLAMRQDGEVFASAGSDYVVRVYDEASCSVCRTLDHGDGVTTNGHTNHVFALAWHPGDPQVLLSGGWDNRVLVWDLRVHRSVRSISGPHLCGDALDLQPGSCSGSSNISGSSSGAGGVLLTGSWRHSAPLQLWDLGSGRLLSNLPWWQPQQDACLPYAARFGRGQGAEGCVMAGGSGSQPVVRVYKMNDPGDVELQFSVRLDRPVHALVQLKPTQAASGPMGQSGPVLAVCCDKEIHTVSLAPGGAEAR